MRLEWDKVGEKFYETGVDQAVLFVADGKGGYKQGVAWNGIVSVTESPSGAESTKQYADNIPYLNLISAEEFGATLEAFTYPKEFYECDGMKEIHPGVTIGQQNRRQFALGYRTIVGNDVDGEDHGYKYHIIYGATAAPSEKAYSTKNDSPEAITFSWEITTTPVNVPGYKPSASLTFESAGLSAEKMQIIEGILYGSVDSESRLPLPEEIISILEKIDADTEVTPPETGGDITE